MYLKPADECDCNTCIGNSVPNLSQEEEPILGGWACACDCHNAHNHDVLAFLIDLGQQGYDNIKVLPNGDWAATHRFLFTTAIVSDLHEYGYEDRWCYHTQATAEQALEAWSGIGEPQGWHRHPGTGRRRPDGEAGKEHIER
jgi:hypothetical protein